MTTHDLKIPKRSLQCDVCGHAFVAGEKCFSILRADSLQREMRTDCCLSCWSSQMIGNQREIFWSTKIPFKKKKNQAPDLAISAWFFSQESTQHPQLKAWLALYLHRKHQLVRRPELDREGFLFYEEVHTGMIEGVCAHLEMPPLDKGATEMRCQIEHLLNL